MKKILLVIAMVVAVAANVNAQTAKIALQHNGNVTLYASDAMKTAMDAAVKGDTIYLNEGNFIGDVTINKEVSIIGAGQNSKITGNVTVAIPNNPKLTSIVLDALYITGNLKFTAPMENVKIRKCEFGTTSFSADVSNVVFDRCFCTSEFVLSNFVKSLTALNTKIIALKGTGNTSDASNFINCNIYTIYGEWSGTTYYGTYNSFFKGVVINSIVYSISYNSSSYRYLGPDVTLVNCLLSDGSINFFTNYSVNQNCMSSKEISYSGSLINNSSLECAISNETLQNYNMLGNDGKIVGIYGGATPFSLVPTVPTVTSSKIVVDTENHKLNVDIKVTAN